MNKAEEDQGAAPRTAKPKPTQTESGTARARRILIAPLSGLGRPRGVADAVLRDKLDKLARKLDYMEELHLKGLAELCLAHAGQVALSKGVATPTCPDPDLVLAWALALQPPPLRVSDYPASVMRSAMGRRAFDNGYGVELLRSARRHGPPPGAYSLVKLKDEAEANRHRRTALRLAIEAGTGLTADQDGWLKTWHDDALAVERLVAEGDERREAKGEAA